MKTKTSNLLHIFILSIATLLVGCSPKIDGTSIESFADSLKKISSGLSPDQARDFDKDLESIMALKNANLLGLRTYVNGMTTDEVHQAAEALRESFKQQRIAQIKSDIEKVEIAEAKVRAETLEVEKINIETNEIKAHINYDPEGYDKPENRSIALSLKIRNGTSHAIKEFYYHLNLEIDGTSYGDDPWSYAFEEPLAAGQVATIVVDDKGKNENNARTAISSRVTDRIFEAIRKNEKSAISATVKSNAIVLSDGTMLRANQTVSGSSDQLRKELAEITTSER